MEEKKVNRKKVIKGIRYLVISLPLAFLGPSVIYNAYGKNQDKPMFIPVMIVGFLLLSGAGYCMFKGIKTIMKGLFND